MQHTEAHFLQELNAHAAIIHKICRAYFADEEIRRDMYQEIIYQLWRSYPTFKGLSKFSTWMYKIALNTAITFQQKARRESPAGTPKDDFTAAQDMEKDLAAKDAIATLYAAINRLSEIEKAVILLYLEEHSYEEIATITGLSKANVSVRLFRIKKKLEQIYKQQSFSSWKI